VFRLILPPTRSITVLELVQRLLRRHDLFVHSRIARVTSSTNRNYPPHRKIGHSSSITLFEKLSASKRESEEHGLKEDSCITKIDPLTRKFQGMALTQPAASETHQAEQEILAQPFDGKKMSISRINSDAILNKYQNSLHLGAIKGPSCALRLGSSRTSCPRWSMAAWTRTHWSLPLISYHW
jgi:hypothetical protein